jgi:hypothetical protein
MNDRELDQLLRSAQLPARPDDYWRDFPKRITAKLHWLPRPSAPTVYQRLDSLLAWGLGVATICLAVIFVIHSRPAVQTARPGPAKDEQLAEARKCYREFEGLFTNQLQAIVFDQKGPRMILSDKANLPNSTPLYVKVCGPAGCVAFVTFSGQHIPFNGENCEVLADGRDEVMLVGNRHVWSQSDASAAVHIEARLL